jgi:hemoglobin-like flavoprotein
MTPRQVEMVRAAFDRSFPVHGRMTERFYDELFRSAPELRPLFPDDMAPLRRKFTNMLAAIVGVLDQPDLFASIVHDLGRRHARYGVRPELFPPVATALLASLDESAPPDPLDEDGRAAWTAVLERVRAMMEQGMRAERPVAR